GPRADHRARGPDVTRPGGGGAGRDAGPSAAAGQGFPAGGGLPHRPVVTGRRPLPATGPGQHGRPPVPAGPVPTGVDVVTTEAAERPGRPPVVQRSDAADVHSLQTLGALLGLELDALVLHQVTAAGALDRAE